MRDNIFAKLDIIVNRAKELSELMSSQDVISNPQHFQSYAKEFSELSRIVEKYEGYKKTTKELEDNKLIVMDNKEDGELRLLAEAEVVRLKDEQEKIKQSLIELLFPKDHRDSKNVLLEIRAGAGGEEAALFASALYRMYSKYSERQGWRLEVLNSNVTGKGGFKEIIVLIEGKDVYSKLKFESGTHRVQRVPETEASGRIHTSTATVAILPEVEDVEVNIDPNDIRIDIFRSSGPGGQSVNTTDSAVRITHIPTGIVVSMQDEKSQHKNKAKALKVLRARLMDKCMQEQQMERAKERKSQVGTGDRSERIRTYNFPQGRVTDHRIGLTLYKIEEIIDGNIDEFIEKLAIDYQTRLISEQDDNETTKEGHGKLIKASL